MSNASRTDGAEELGYMLYDNGWYFAKSDDFKEAFGVAYGEGDALTVCLDLDANTIAFRKNGVLLSPQAIEHDAYYFALDTIAQGDAVTIVNLR